MNDVQGRCPACGGASLFLGEGGHVTCSRLDCPAPDTADALLHGGETALIQALGSDRRARVIAHTLHFHGYSLADVRRMTDEQLLAVPGIGETSLARIRAAIPAPESGEAASSPLRDQIAEAIGRTNLPMWHKGARYEAAEAALSVVLPHGKFLGDQLRDSENTLGRVLDVIETLCREPHPSHDHVCPDDVRKAVRDAIHPPADQPKEATDVR